MSQITIRDLPDPVEAELRRRAAERRVSLSKMVSLLLAKALGFEPKGGQARDVSCLFGRWDSQEFEDFERNTADFQRIDDELWK